MSAVEVTGDDRRPAGERLRRWASLAAAMVLAAVLGGCASLPRVPFTEAEQAVASPAGFSHIRYTQDDPALAEMLQRSLKPDARGGVDVLAISGGGANGAYGAGLLYGWSQTGHRPKFQLVTGVSTGALTAPFAFLGQDWDERLRTAYFGAKVEHLLQRRGLPGLLTPGLYRKAPLEDLVRSYVTEDLVRAVAAEHAKGRRLLVATTNLDTEQLNVWDMGAIAAQGGPAARTLFAQVLVASASVPGVFPPSLIPVEGGGRQFSEMHVDGQAESAFFAIPQTLLMTQRLPAPRFRARLFIIVNGRLDSQFAVTPHATIPILGRTLDAANKASVRSVVITVLEFCRYNGCDMHVASLPSTEKDDSLDFSAAHVTRLFAAGHDAAAAATTWRSTLPD